jgi:carbon-monoxide dehydrogenase small subunit
MLATARDIVLRLPDADEARVRLELSGNLCRCTGYQGIVDAVLDVLQQQRETPNDQIRRLRETWLSSRTTTAAGTVALGPLLSPAPEASDPVAHADVDPGAMVKAKAKGNAIDAYFDVPYPLEQVWQFMGDLPAVASCLPGAKIDSHDGERVKGSISIKFGPMSAAFAGAARLERDDVSKRAVLRGAGQDSLSKSRAQGDISYSVQALTSDNTRVQVDMVYSLQGPLAQFSRSGLVKDFVRRMIADLGKQVGHRLSGQTTPSSEPLSSASMVRVMLSVLWNRVRGWFK